MAGGGGGVASGWGHAKVVACRRSAGGERAGHWNPPDPPRARGRTRPGERIAIPEGPGGSIGRDAASDIVLDDAGVSRRARSCSRAPALTLHDRGRRLDQRHPGERHPLSQERLLADGDEVRMGAMAFRRGWRCRRARLPSRLPPPSRRSRPAPARSPAAPRPRGPAALHPVHRTSAPRTVACGSDGSCSWGRSRTSCCSPRPWSSSSRRTGPASARGSRHRSSAWWPRSSTWASRP